jgi:hypothetical protein
VESVVKRTVTVAAVVIVCIPALLICAGFVGGLLLIAAWVLQHL